MFRSDDKPITIHQPCPTCGSSDALSEWIDRTYCHSCDTFKVKEDTKFSLDKSKFFDIIRRKKERTKEDTVGINHSSNTYSSTEDSNYKDSKLVTNYSKQYMNWRSINKDTFKVYGSIFNVDEQGKPIEVVFPYLSSTGEAANKIRKIDTKEFYSTGAMHDSSLFGMDRFSAGSARAITVTEGELDALSVYQMLGSKYPSVSVRGASSARRDCERARDYLNSFERIYLCFDNDEPGLRAVKEVSQLFDVNKVIHVQLTKFKDANAYLEAGAAEEFSKVWWNSKPYLPKGIVNDYESVGNILKQEDEVAVATYPFPTINNMTYGIRLGELLLFTAQEKVGKTEVIRAIEYHLLKTTDDNIGIIHLEEEEKRSVQGLVGYELGVAAHLPDSGLSIDDQLKAYQALSKRDGRVHFYSHFGSDDVNAILDVIRYLVGVCHCKYIFLDHITMLVTGYEGDDERKKLDYLSTRLAMMTRELNFTLFLVSHVNDDGKTRGSRNISKVADLIVSLDRDIEASTFEERNKTRLTVKGNRYAGLSGPAGTLVFDAKSFTLKELSLPDEDVSYDPGF